MRTDDPLSRHAREAAEDWDADHADLLAMVIERHMRPAWVAMLGARIREIKYDCVTCHSADVAEIERLRQICEERSGRIQKAEAALDLKKQSIQNALEELEGVINQRDEARAALDRVRALVKSMSEGDEHCSAWWWAEKIEEAIRG